MGFKCQKSFAFFAVIGVLLTSAAPASTQTQGQDAVVGPEMLTEFLKN